MTRLIVWLLLGVLLLAAFVGWRTRRAAHGITWAVGPPLPEGRVRPQLVINDGLAVFLAPDGTLWRWGDASDFSGGLSQTPIRFGSDTDWVAVAGGCPHVLALKSDGSLWRWDEDLSFDAAVRATPPKISRIGADTDWTQIAVSLTGWYALKRDGSLWRADRRDLNFSPRRVPVEMGADGKLQKIIGNVSGVFALKLDGTLHHCADLQSDVDPAVPLLKPLGHGGGWVAVAAGDSDLVAIKSDGSLWAQGATASVTTDITDSANGAGFVRIGAGADWAEVHAGPSCYLARKRDGTWWACGFNEFGRLGFAPRGRHVLITAPERVPFEFDPWALAMGNATVVFARDGSLWSWGERIGAPDPPTALTVFPNLINVCAAPLPGSFRPFYNPNTVWDARPRKIWQWQPGARDAAE